MEQSRPPVERLMTSGVLTVTGDTAVEDAAATMLAEGIGSLVVVDDDGNPVGMFTNSDLAAFVSDGESQAGVAVAEYMTDSVVSIDTRSSLSDAAAKMIRHDVHHLPVTDDGGRVVGMLSTMDLTAYFSYTGGSDIV